VTSSETSKAARESRSSEANGSGSSNKSLIQRSNDPGCTFLQFQLPEDHISLAHARYQSFSITSVEEDSGDGTEEHEAEVQAAEIDRRFHRIINRIADREAFQEFNNMIYAVARARGGWLPSPVADVLDDVWLRHSAQDLDGPQWADLLAFDTEISKISPKKIGVKLRKLLGFPHVPSGVCVWRLYYRRGHQKDQGPVTLQSRGPGMTPRRVWIRIRLGPI